MTLTSDTAVLDAETSAPEAATPDAELPAPPVVDRSWHYGTGRALGVAGCVLAATDADGATWRLQLPLQRVALVKLRIRPATADRVQPLDGSPLELTDLLTAGLAAAGLFGVEVSGSVRTDIWHAAALGGDAAVAAAALRALAVAAGEPVEHARIAGLLAAAGHDPAAAYPAASLVDAATGAAAAAQLPRLLVAVAAPRASAPAPRPVPVAGPAELAELHRALTDGPAATAAVATATARRAAAGDPALTAALERLDGGDVPGLLGVLTGGAGGAVGLLFDGNQDGRRYAQAALPALLEAAPGYAVSIGLTPLG